MKNGKPYEVKIGHNDERHTYKSNNKLFSTETHMITK